MDEKIISVPAAVGLLKTQTDDTLQFCDRETLELFAIRESHLEIAEDWGTISAYRAYSARQLRYISHAQDFLGNPDGFIPLPRLDKLDHNALMLSFAAAQSDEIIRKKLTAAAKSIFGNKFKRFREEIDRFGITEEWKAFLGDAYGDYIKKWCEDNSLPFTDEDIPLPVYDDEEEEAAEETDGESGDESEDEESVKPASGKKEQAESDYTPMFGEDKKRD